MALQRLIVSSEQILGNQISLTTEQQHYLYRVLRLSAGKRFIVLDGRGRQWIAALTDNPHWADVVETAPPLVPTPAQPRVTLALAIPKGSGFDDVVRQATELGVTTLQPLITERTLHQPNPKKLERWRRIAAEATEQSERLLLPTIAEPLPWAEYVPQTVGRQRFLCVARGAAPHLLTLLQPPSQPPTEEAIILAIGPEGGWTPAEIALATNYGYQPASLGAGILRAVTAPLAAMAVVMALWESSRETTTSD